MKRCFIYAVVMLLLITACGKSDDKQNVKINEGVTLDVVTPFSPEDGSYIAYTELCAIYEQQYGVTVNDDSTQSTEEWKSSVLRSFETGGEPDVLFFFVAQDAEPFISSGKVVSVDEIREVYPDYCMNISSNVLNTLRSNDNNIYAVPVMGYWEGVFINRDLFDAHSVKVPENWDEFTEAVEKFNRVGITPVAAALGDIPHYWFEFLIYNYTGPSGHLKTVPTRENLSLDYWGKGLADFKTLYDMGAFPENTNTMSNAEAIELFQNKEAAMLADGSWSVGNITDRENVEVIFFPSKTTARKNTDIIGGFSMGFYISRKAWDDADKRSAAVMFVENMASNEGINEFAANGAAPPISKRLEQSDSHLITSVMDMSSQSTAFTAAVQDGLKKEAREYIFSQIPLIVTGEAEVSDVIGRFVELNE